MKNQFKKISQIKKITIKRMKKNLTDEKTEGG